MSQIVKIREYKVDYLYSISPACLSHACFLYQTSPSYLFVLPFPSFVWYKWEQIHLPKEDHPTTEGTTPKAAAQKTRLGFALSCFLSLPSLDDWWRYGRLWRVWYTILLFPSLLPFRAMSGSGTNRSEWVYFTFSRIYKQLTTLSPCYIYN